MADRQRIRVGREVTYRPTDAEATTGNGSAGDEWYGKITRVLANGTVNLHVLEADGTTLALTGVSQGARKGQFDLRGLAHHA